MQGQPPPQPARPAVPARPWPIVWIRRYPPQTQRRVTGAARRAGRLQHRRGDDYMPAHGLVAAVGTTNTGGQLLLGDRVITPIEHATDPRYVGLVHRTLHFFAAALLRTM